MDNAAQSNISETIYAAKNNVKGFYAHYGIARHTNTCHYRGWRLVRLAQKPYARQ